MRDASTVNIHELIEIGYHETASDIFIKAGSKPMMRQHSQVIPVPGEWPVIDQANAKRIVYELMSEKQQKVFEHVQP